MARKLKPESVEQKGPDAAVVKSYARKIAAEKPKMDKARGEIGQFYKQFEDMGGHKAALKLAMKLADMEEAASQDHWRALHAYVEALGVFAQGDMFDSQAQASEEDAPTEGEAGEGEAPAEEDITRDPTYINGLEAGRLGHSRRMCPYKEADEPERRRRWLIAHQVAVDEKNDAKRREAAEAREGAPQLEVVH